MSTFGTELNLRTSAEPLYVQIVQQVRNAIQHGELKIDEPLPSERELAQLFCVSRVPVREALKTLEFMGVVERIPGFGMVVRALTMDKLLESLDFLISDPHMTLKDLFEVRIGIEPQAAKLAALRRTDDDLADIERTLIQMEVEIRHGCPVQDTSEIFHTALVRASHNQILIKIHECLHNLLSFSRKQTLREQKRYGHVLAYHRTIFNYVKAGNGDAAAASMLEHMHDALASIGPDHEMIEQTQ